MTSLRQVLRLNAASCLGFGVIFTLAPDAVSVVLGAVPPIVVLGLGVVLIANGAHLMLASRRVRLSRIEILWFSLGDLAWWLLTLGFVAAGVWITTVPGIAAALGVALAVAALGVTQLALVGMERTGLKPTGHWGRVGRSLLVLPLRVKIWLMALNGVFIASPAVLPWSEASVILTAYVASGPLVLAFAAFEGGLNRAMGIGHLVPWAPMLVWLTAWITEPGPDPLELGYATLLAAMTGLCLGLDIYDLSRWYRGDRDILSAPRGKVVAERRSAAPS